ncbi:MAG: cyclopropane-fatty-acyl-phospholipid synthase family protein [Wenzhouxiangellaceae bacterium]|nr:cyclopropane-fatty-acyl-phospholipid synthase family protein [Wenzhouxiangellaceae bacterium]
MSIIDLAESGRLPDVLIRIGIRRLLRKRLADEFAGDPERAGEAYARRIEELAASPIALATDAANEQHYEVPAGFYQQVLGEHLKYSSCLWEPGVDSLNEAEARMLALSCERAALADGQDILELGCGWGSLTLWMAAHYPNSRITAVSNSASQRAFILRRAAERGLTNLEVLTRDVNQLALERQFDRVVSIEMFEHVRNYRHLLARIHGWLKPGGSLFVHIFCHRTLLYPFETEGDDNWMGRHFFTGGLMPAADTLLWFQEHLKIQQRWLVNGRHYARTARAWLELLDARRTAARAALADSHPDPERQLQRWRMFFMACEELFAWRGGREWMVAHYRFEKPLG